MAPIPRLPLVAATLSLACSCAWLPVPEKPRVSVEPVGAILRLDGRASMASFGGGGIQPNLAVDLRNDLNVADRDFGIGARVAYGDGFQGAELNFLRWEQKSFSSRGTLTQDFGALQRNDTVGSEVLFNQLRLHYVAKVFEESELTEATFRIGIGAGIHHNQLRFELESQGSPPLRIQNLKIKDDGMPVLIGRAEAEWDPFKLRLQIAASTGDWGDIDGTVWDLMAQAHYKVTKTVSAWVGYWRYSLPASGHEGLLPFDFDMNLQGYMAGVRLSF